jgi:hypothetical protein
MLKLREKLYTLSDVARMFDSNPTEFWNAVYVKKIIFPPQRQVGDRPRKYYTEKDVRAIGKLLETTKRG